MSLPSKALTMTSRSGFALRLLSSLSSRNRLAATSTASTTWSTAAFAAARFAGLVTTTLSKPPRALPSTAATAGPLTPGVPRAAVPGPARGSCRRLSAREAAGSPESGPTRRSDTPNRRAGYFPETAQRTTCARHIRCGRPTSLRLAKPGHHRAARTCRGRELRLENAQGRLQESDGTVRMATRATAFDHRRPAMQLGQVSEIGLPAGQAGRGRRQAPQAEEARPALRCAFVGQVLNDPGRDIERVCRLIKDADHAATKGSAGRTQPFRVEGHCASLACGDPAAEIAAQEHGACCAADPPGKRQHLIDGGSTGDLDYARPGDGAAHRQKDGARGSVDTKRTKPGIASTGDERSVGQALHVLDQGRVAVHALLERPRRYCSWSRDARIHKIDGGGLLARNVAGRRWKYPRPPGFGCGALGQGARQRHHRRAVRLTNI